MLLIISAIIFSLVARVESGACGCGLPPPMPMCPPALPPMPMCPPPVICPPPPIPLPCPACPLPLPPPPCPLPLPPMCPPPQFCPPPMPAPNPCYAQAPIAPQPSYAPAPSNDCCCQCGGPQCKFRGRARTHGSRIFSALSVTQEEDPTCNSEKLRAVIEENITSDPTISKRAIQAAAEERLFAKINVICGREDFSYVMYTDTYCQATSGDVTCYAFRPLVMGMTSDDM